MSAQELVQLVNNLLFGLIFIASLVNVVRHRRRANVDLAFLFGLPALAIGAGAIASQIGLAQQPWYGDMIGAAIMGIPYFMVRLADDLAVVPRRILRGAVAGWVLSAVAFFVIPGTLPGAVTLGLVLYFAAFGGYAAVFTVRESRRVTGVVRRRLQALAFGSFFLAAVVLLAGVALFLPVPPGTSLVLALASALSYLVAISPPAFLRGAWQMPQLTSFLDGALDVAREPELWGAVARLERAATKATGGAGAHIGLWDDGAGVLRFHMKTGELALKSGESMSGRVFASQRATLSADPDRDSTHYRDYYDPLATGAILSAPMSLGDRRLGVLNVVASRAPLFAEDDLAFVTLLARQAAVALETVRLYDDVRKASRAKSEFLSSMSHELRTPMNAILGFTALLQEQLATALTDRQRRYFQNISDAGQHLLALVNDVLDLSKVEAGKVELRPEAIEVEALFEPVIAAARQTAAERTIHFDAAIQGGALVRVDAARVRQVLYNLTSNALKFTPGGGRVSIVAGLDGDDLDVEVRDTGIGIPADRRERVFAMFERLNEGRSEASGTGLGLALTKRLVELHGGSIGFDSEENAGTTFRFRLPDVAVQAITGERLLVIDDDANNADLVVEAARQHGLRSEVVGSALGALAAIRRNPPLGVVLDLRLPDERGERVLEMLRADPATRGMPVIVVTVEDDDGRARVLGADDHLTKPLDRARLAAWLVRVAALRSEQRPLVKV
jgi:signal transduction histidine kinase/CheY-like chemotaxis protein